MDLWIRSQDKERLFKVSTLFVEYNGDVNPTISSHRIVADKCIDLGIYKSKERALEVLDEIQKYINNGCKRFIDTGVYHTSKYEYRVYEMPKE